jgi:hypothetical protein
MLRALSLLLATVIATAGAHDVDGHHHHRHHHHRHHHHKHVDKIVDAPAAKAQPAHAVKALPALSVVKSKVTDKDILAKMKQLESEMDTPLIQAPHGTGNIKVNGPLEKGFDATFAAAVSDATGCKAEEVKVTKKTEDKDAPGVVELEFTAPMKAVSMVKNQAADPDSKLAKGELRPFLVEKDDDEEAPKETKEEEEKEEKKEKKEKKEDKEEEKEEKKDKKEKKEKKEKQAPKEEKKEEKEEKEEDEAKVPAGLEVEEEEEKIEPAEAKPKKAKKAKKVKREGVEPSGSAFDIDAEMPYGDLEPFGREDTAQELTEASIKESNAMVDQLERAEVAEEKRAVFRALTRLRGAAITSFDGVARSQTGNIDEYNKVNKWRKTHPLHHLADEESDVSRWAFPDIADF